MKLKVLVYVLVLLVFSSSIFAQETKVEKKGEHAFGVAVGFTTGFGYSYRYFGKKMGVQGTFFPNISKNRTYYLAGLTFLYKLHQGKNTSFYIYEGNLYMKNRRNTHYPDGSFKDNSFNFGAGIGIELFFDHISLNIMGGYASYDAERFLPTVESALYYKF
jgi:hypothetical protein